VVLALTDGWYRLLLGGCFSRISNSQGRGKVLWGVRSLFILLAKAEVLLIMHLEWRPKSVKSLSRQN
jgi:hypothetical protein